MALDGPRRCSRTNPRLTPLQKMSFGQWANRPTGHGALGHWAICHGPSTDGAWRMAQGQRSCSMGHGSSADGLRGSVGRR